MPTYLNTIKLLRIPFSLFLMPIFLLALSQAEKINSTTALWSFIIIHLMVYPASNGYNSYIDRDESSIGGLKNPPMPTIHLFYITLILDVLALILAAVTVNIFFALCIVLYIIASRAYSSRQIRLKKYPLPAFLIVIIFQGAFTYYIAYLGITAEPLILNSYNYYILLACSFQIAGVYPLTQIYQHKEDVRNGDITLSYKLGYKGTFIFTTIMFIFSNLFYYKYFTLIGKPVHFFYLQLFFLPIIIYFLNWFYQVSRNSTHANFENTMRMNLIASICMNSCFLFFIFLNYFL